MPAENFRPPLSAEMAREINVVASMLQMTPVNFVRSCVEAGIESWRQASPEIAIALKTRIDDAERAHAVRREAVTA